MDCQKSVKFAASNRSLIGCDPGAVGLRVRAAGGNANNGANAGAFATNANNAASNANANYSSPLYKLVKKTKAMEGPDRATRQKMTNEAEGAGRTRGGGSEVSTVPEVSIADPMTQRPMNPKQHRNTDPMTLYEKIWQPLCADMRH